MLPARRINDAVAVRIDLFPLFHHRVDEIMKIFIVDSRPLAYMAADPFFHAERFRQ